MRLDLPPLLTTEVKEPHWIVKGIVPAGTIVLVAGDPGVGKSVVNLSEALHVALGLPFLGHDTTQSKVLYFDEENSQPDLAAYLQQLWIGMGKPDPKEIAPWLRLEHFSLGTPDWYLRMSGIVEEYQPGIVYIDTATSALAIRDENDNSEAQRALQRIRQIMQKVTPAPAIKIIKHAKHQEKSPDKEGGVRRTIRGAKAWLGAVDQVMYHIVGRGAPPKNGLRRTVLVPDKSRAFGLRGNIGIVPSWMDASRKGLILNTEVVKTDKDLMEV